MASSFFVVILDTLSFTSAPRSISHRYLEIGGSFYMVNVGRRPKSMEEWLASRYLPVPVML